MASRICDKINDSIKRGRKGTRGGGGGLPLLTGSRQPPALLDRDGPLW